jgi:outer membrane protein OmpA-like peptidoglycan-associated protein
MLNMNFLRTAAIAAIALAPLTAARAQSNDASQLSEQELEDLFANQRTRGLILAPTGAQDNTADDGSAVTTPATETYVQLAPEDQVSIQISFSFDSAALEDNQLAKLATLCQVMNASVEGLFRIVGHTDASGSASYNERLSLLRAQEVKRYMVSDCGIAEDRLEAIGVGESFLLDETDPRGDENRRVEFQALS